MTSSLSSGLCIELAGVLVKLQSSIGYCHFIWLLCQSEYLWISLGMLNFVTNHSHFCKLMTCGVRTRGSGICLGSLCTSCADESLTKDTLVTQDAIHVVLLGIEEVSEVIGARAVRHNLHKNWLILAISHFRPHKSKDSSNCDYLRVLNRNEVSKVSRPNCLCET